MKSLQPRNSDVLCMTDEAIDSLAKRYTSVLLQVERAVVACDDGAADENDADGG